MSDTEKFLGCLLDTFTLDYSKGFPNVNDPSVKGILEYPVWNTKMNILYQSAEEGSGSWVSKMRAHWEKLAALSGKPIADHALIFKFLETLRLAAWNIAGWGLKSQTADWYFHKFQNLKDEDGKDTAETFEQWKNRMGSVLKLASIIFDLKNLDIICIEEGPTFLDQSLTNEQRIQALACLSWFSATARANGLVYVYYPRSTLDPLGHKMGQGFLVRVSDHSKFQFLSVETDVEINDHVFKLFVEHFKTSQWFVTALEKSRVATKESVKNIVAELTAQLATEELSEIDVSIEEQALQQVTNPYMYTLWKMCPVLINQVVVLNIHGKWGLNPEAYAWIIKAKGDLVAKKFNVEFDVKEIAVIGDYNIHASDMQKAVDYIIPTAQFFTTNPAIGSHSGGGLPPPKGNGLNK